MDQTQSHYHLNNVYSSNRMFRFRPTIAVVQRTYNACSLSSEVGHTGQQFPEGDQRNARYLGGKQKEVNPNFAVKMVAEEPVEVTGATHAWCSGGHGALGHPKVFVNLDKGITKACGYCGKQFRAH